MREFQRKTLLILSLGVLAFAGSACLSTENQRLCIAILTGCPLCEQGEVAFPATPRKAVANNDAEARAAALAKRRREEAARAAALAKRTKTDPPKRVEPKKVAVGENDLDKTYQKLKKEIKDAGIKLDDIADGFKARGLLVKKVAGGNGNTREILIRFDGDVSFRHGSARLTNRAGRLVDKVGNAMNQYPSTKAKVHGHTDSTGSRRYNTRLSRQRARSVEKRLIRQKGIAKSRILEVKGFADRFRIVNTRRSEPRNRRVEIKIVFENPGGIKVKQ